MFAGLLELFKPKNKMIKPRPLRMSTEYKYVSSANTLFNNLPPDVASVYKNASTLPLLSNATLTICDINSNTRFVGFNKPKKVCGHVIVYPEETLHRHREKLFELAQKNSMNVGIFKVEKEQKCIQVAQNGKTYFLVNPQSLKLRSWSYSANPYLSAQNLRPR